ncbi:MAG: hypothetical protein RL358_1876 [Pseudomonadota bacterium]|jgi:hypothetical protein
MKKWLVAAVLCLSSLNAAAYDLEIIALQHRSVEEVLPLIQSFLNQDEVAQGMNYQLMVRASPAHLAQVKQLIASLDTAPRRLKITVLQDIDRATVASLNEASGRVALGNSGRITLPNSGAPADGVVHFNQGGNDIALRASRQEAQLKDHKSQQLQVIEGGRAFINVGQAVPVQQRQVFQTPWGAEVVEQTQYQQVGSGFYVQPRVQGARVTLDISTENDAVESRHNVSVQHASSTVSGRLGEWIELGGVAQQQQNSGGSYTSRRSSQSDETRNIFIRVEEITE